MKTTGRVFSIIGGVFALTFAFGLIVGSIFMFLVNVPEIKESFINLLNDLTERTSVPFNDFADIIITGSIVSGIINIVFAVFAVLAGIFSLLCHKNKNYVLTIVFGAIAYFQFFVVLGAIFGLIFDKKTE
jgi:hypothetical protein